jgi:hypothetical protein
MSSSAIYDGNLGEFVIDAPRRLGSIFPRPRNLYMLYLPLMMLTVGLSCWLLEDDTMLIVGAMVLAGVSLYLFYDLTVRRATLRFTTVLVTTLGLGYGLGTANTWFTLPRSGQGLGVFLHKDPAQLTHTMGSILFSLSIVLSIGEMFEKPIFGEEFELQFPPQTAVFISVGCIVLVVAYATGALNFMGATIGEGGSLGIFPAFAAWLIGTLFAITLVAALNAKTKGLKRYLSILTVGQFLLEIPIGRRSLIYTIVLAILALRLGRFRFNWSWPKRILVGTLLAGLLYVASVGFFYMRLAGFASGKTHLGIIERVTLAITYFESKDYSEVQKSFSQNVQVRTFILGFLSELEGYSTHFTLGYGRDLEGQFLEAVPSVLYPSKDRYFGEEGLANELFGTVYGDEGNSILTGGVIDFGLAGMVAYPLLIAFMLRAFVEFAGQTMPTFVATFMIFSAFAGLLHPEIGVTEYFIVIRNGLLFSTFVWFFIALPAFRLRKEVG